LFWMACSLAALFSWFTFVFADGVCRYWIVSSS
jgi:hypothetical protein